MTRIKLMADEEEKEEYSENNIKWETFIESQKPKEHQISYDDSLNTEDSINTMNTSEANTSQHSQPVHDNNDNNGDSQLSFQYDVHDHTTSFTSPQISLPQVNSISNNNNNKNIKLSSCLPPHVMVVPQELLVSSNDNLLNTMESYSSCSSEQHEHIECKTTSNVNGIYVTSETIARNQEDMTNIFVNALGGGRSSESNKLKLNAKLMKLPHPRHGQLVYFLISSKLTCNKESTSVNVNSANKAESKIYELHAQRTSSSFPLTWFIDNTVIPSRVDYMYLTSSFNIGYLTLRILLESNNICQTNMERQHNNDNNSCIYKNNNHNKAEHCFVSKEQLLSSFYQTASYQHNDITLYDDSTASKDFMYKDNEYHKNNKMPQMREWCEEQEQKYSLQKEKEEWNGWLVMAQNNLTLQVLLQEIISHTQLAKFCDYKCISFNSVSDINDSSANDCSKQNSEYYYKFSKSKVVDWLVERIHRLERSDTLRELLHLPTVNQNNKTDLKATNDKKSSDSEDECNKRNQRQCTEAAFQLVMEYVDKCMHDEVAQACDLPCTNTYNEKNNVNSITVITKCKRSTTGYSSIDEDKENVFDDALLSPSTSYKKERIEGKEMSARQRQSTEKSASVKRLEKAGKPANTPTLFEMFASKNKSRK